MKRFTETTKWDDPWYRKLSPKLKCLWQYICDRCDAAGVIDVDYELASFQIGDDVTEKDLGGFGSRIEQLKCGKWWILRFIPFQYGTLSEDCKAHGPVYSSLCSYGLKDRVSKGYPKAMHSLKEKDKDKDKEKDNARESDFLQFWAAYPRKDAKQNALKAWMRAEVEIATAVAAIARQRKSEQWRKDDGKWIPLPASWLNGRRWEDAGAEVEKEPSSLPVKPLDPDRKAEIEREASEFEEMLARNLATGPQ